MSLIDIHEEMLKEAKEQEVTEEENEEVKERLEVLSKYAALAEELLEEEYGEDYNEEDVTKLAEYIIDSDLQAQEEYEKVAEYDQYGRIMARAYVDEINDLISDK